MWKKEIICEMEDKAASSKTQSYQTHRRLNNHKPAIFIRQLISIYHHIHLDGGIVETLHRWTVSVSVQLFRI